MSVRIRLGVAIAVVVAAAAVAVVPTIATRPNASAVLRGLAPGTAAAARPCALVGTEQVRRALGVDSDAYVAGPRSETAASCSWHSAQPNCFTRSLSVVLHVGGGAAAGFAAARAEALPLDVVAGLGDEAFFTTEPLPPGAAVAIEHLSLRRGTAWVQVTMLGRISGDGAHDLMRAIAPTIVERLAALAA